MADARKVAAILSILFLVVQCRAALFDQPYADGVASYKENEWSDVVSFMEMSWQHFSRYSEALEKCSLACSEKTSKPVDYTDEQALLFYHSVIEVAACYKNCFDKNGVDVRDGVNQELYGELKKGEPFSYLQMSYYQMGNNEKASSAATKFASMNPLTDVSKENLAFYSNTMGQSIEATPPAYQQLYEVSIRAYSSENYTLLVEQMEQSLAEFLLELKRCRTSCSGPVGKEGAAEFSTGMARSLVSFLECRKGCVHKLGEFPRDTDDYFLMSYFRYLHVGYFKLKKYNQAVQSFMTQKRLIPDGGEELLNNEGIYRKVDTLTDEDWKEREDMAPVLDALETDHFMINTLQQLMGPDSHLEGAGPEVDADPADDFNDQMLLDQDYIDHPVGLVEEAKLEVVSTNHTVERVVADKFLDEKQCRNLMQLARIGTEGDGYNRASPHTKHERFEGLTILAASEAALRGNTSTEQAQLYLDSCEAVRVYVEAHFKLPSPLYYSYSHLVCRTAKDENKDRTDLSHPVHSDNCILDVETGECNKVPPAYTWRDYSAILYLNEDFTGGKFFFAHSTKDLTPEVYVEPTCGRMVGFSAGKENLHGVTAVTNGRRCAIALWFTLDADHQELSMVEAKKILSQM